MNLFRNKNDHFRTGGDKKEDSSMEEIKDVEEGKVDRSISGAD